MMGTNNEPNRPGLLEMRWQEELREAGYKGAIEFDAMKASIPPQVKDATGARLTLTIKELRPWLLPNFELAELAFALGHKWRAAYIIPGGDFERCPGLLFSGGATKEEALADLLINVLHRYPELMTWQH